MNTALYEPRTDASGCSTGTIAGCTRALDRAVVLLGDREQLHDVAELRGRADVVGGDLRVMPSRYTSPATTRAPNAIDAMIAAFAAASKPVDVGGRVGLGVAELLRLGDARRRTSEPSSVMLREHVVGGAVHDAGDAPDALPHQRLAQRPDQRDAARDRRLEQQVDARGRRDLEQLLRRSSRAAPCSRSPRACPTSAR